MKQKRAAIFAARFLFFIGKQKDRSFKMRQIPHFKRTVFKP